MVLFKVDWMTIILLFSLHTLIWCINCAKLLDEDLLDVKKIARECKKAEILGRHPDSHFRRLNVASLTDAEFAALFSKKTRLNMGIVAMDSKIKNMNFPKLTVFVEENKKEDIIFYLENNRELRSVHFPVLPNNSLVSPKSAGTAPIVVYANPLLDKRSIDHLRNKVSDSVEWKGDEIENEPGVCVFTDVVRNLADLENCQKVGRHLSIEGAFDISTNAKITDVEGFIRITHSKITDLSFLKLAHIRHENGEYETDEIYSNPELCLDTAERSMIFDQRHTETIFSDNQHPVLCEKPSNSCIGGNLNEPATRKRIEMNDCANVVGDLIIDHLINSETDMTKSLKEGLSRIERIIGGSLTIVFNDGLESLDILPHLKSIYSVWTDGKCREAGVSVHANFKLKHFDLLDRVSVAPDDCPILSIGANGADGRGIMTPQDVKRLSNVHDRKLLTFLAYPFGKRSSQLMSQTAAIILCVVCGILLLAGISIYVFRMITKKRRPVTQLHRKVSTRSEKT